MLTKLKQRIWQWRGVVVASPTAAGIVILIRWIGILQGAELWTFDQFMRSRAPEKPDDRIVIVGISEKDLQTYNFPISDRLLADALNKIKQQQPRVIGLDLYRDLPVPPTYETLAKTFKTQPNLLDQETPIEPGYQSLIEIFQTTPNLIGIERAIGDQAFGRVAPPPKLKELGQVASNDFPRDADTKIRRGFLYLTDNQTQEIVFSLAFKLAMLYLEKDKIEPELTDTDWVKLKNTVFPPLHINKAGQTNDGAYIRTDGAGYQVLLNYRGPKDSFPRVELSEVLEGKIPVDFLRDRIVLIGSTAASLNDYFDTPYSSTIINTPEQTSGVEIHANLTSQILSATLDRRILIKVLPEPIEWLWILAASTVGAIFSWQWRYAKGIFKFLPQLTAISAFGSIAYVTFLQGLWIPVVPPVLALLGSSVGIIGYVARTAGDIRKTFSRYLTDEVVATLLETPEGLKMGGERRKITILTSDLRGFTSLSERLRPEQVVAILNTYLEAMANAITSYQGVIDEFMGDGILVLFGAPIQREDDAERAIACAIAMQLAIPQVNQALQQLDLPSDIKKTLQLEMGIGIHTGEVVVGNIGSTKRTKYGIVGAPVNLTYRIESNTVGGQILVSETALDPLKDVIEIDEDATDAITPKGVSKAVTIYSVIGINGKYNLRLPVQKDIFVVLKQEISIRFSLILEGKKVGEKVFEGSLIEISEHSAWMKVSTPLDLKQNLKVTIVAPEFLGDSKGEFYAKVLKKSRTNNWVYRIGLTSTTSEVDTFWQKQYEMNR